MKKARTQQFDVTYMAVMVTLGVLALSCLTAVCLSAEIQGPDTVETCSGLVRLTIDPEEGHTYHWLVIEPDDLVHEIWPDQSRVLFAAPRAPGVVRAILVDVMLEVDPGDVAKAFAGLPLDPENEAILEVWRRSVTVAKPIVEICSKTVKIVGSDEEEDEDEDDDEPTPIRDPHVIIIYESDNSTQQWARFRVELRKDASLNYVRMFDDNELVGSMSGYRHDIAEGDRPIVIIDDDLDPESFATFPCPDTVEGLKQRIQEYTAPGASSTGNSPPQTDDVSSDSEPSGAVFEAPTHLTTNIPSRDSYREILDTESGDHYMEHVETGERYDILKKADGSLWFRVCVDAVCYELEVAE